MGAVQGLDISSCQGKNVNFAAIKAAGHDFVILRLNEWINGQNVKDTCFDRNFVAAKQAGLNVGVYWFCYANTIDYVAWEASKCIEWLKGKQLEYPVWFDLEREKQFSQGMSFCDAAVNTFCNALSKAGYYVGVYCSTFWYTKCVSASVREKWPCWIAEWNSKCKYTGSYGMWQNGIAYVSGSGTGAIDHDYCYVDYPSIIKSKGLNGFPKPEKALPVLDSGSCYKLGETTVGALAVKELLRLAYVIKLHSVKVSDTKVYDQTAVDAVKAMQKRWGYKETGRAGENFVRMLFEALK